MPAPKRITRDQAFNDETYTPSTDTEIPADVKADFFAQGYYVKWVRSSIGPEETVDRRNLTRKIRDGYDFVSPDEVPTLRDFYDSRKFLTGSKNAVTVGDLVLMKIPVGKANGRRKYYRDLAMSQDAKSRLATAKEAKKWDKTNAGSITNESKSVVSVRERPSFGASEDKDSDQSTDEE